MVQTAGEGSGQAEPVLPVCVLSGYSIAACDDDREPETASAAPSFLPAISLVLTLTLHFAAIFVALPATPDVLARELCGHVAASCPIALYYSAISLAVGALLTATTAPLLGALSDSKFGRKRTIAVALCCHFAPFAMFAIGTSKPFVWAYLSVRTVFGAFNLTLLGLNVHLLQADLVPSASSTSSCPCLRTYWMGLAALLPPSIGNLLGTALSRSSFIPEIAGMLGGAAKIHGLGEATPTIHRDELALFRAAAVMSATAAIGVLVLVPERRSPSNSQKQEKPSSHSVRRQSWLYILCVIVFLSALAERGDREARLFFLKSRFGFARAQLSRVLQLHGATVLGLQAVVAPLVTRALGVTGMLAGSALLNSAHGVLLGLASTPTMAYVAVSIGAAGVLAWPAAASLVAAAAPPHQQGVYQSSLVSARSLADVIGPALFDALTGVFMSSWRPFDCPGIAFLLGGLVAAGGFVLTFPLARCMSKTKFGAETDEEALTRPLLLDEEA
eukprot:jgi/Chlat1/4957/Chrsp32S08945